VVPGWTDDAMSLRGGGRQAGGNEDGKRVRSLAGLIRVAPSRGSTNSLG
jgi:hypothetical protein